MTAIFLILALQAAPAAAVPPPPAPAEEAATPAQTLEGLEQVYSTTCGQTGILYHAYDDLCDGLSKQIRVYKAKMDKDAALKARAAAAARTKP